MWGLVGADLLCWCEDGSMLLLLCIMTLDGGVVVGILVTGGIRVVMSVLILRCIRLLVALYWI